MDALTADERTSLLFLGRAAIRHALGDGDDPSVMLEASPPTPGMRRNAAAFVTVKLPSADPALPAKLRGCIGCMEWNRPLYRRVVELAPKAALHDPRFAPVTAEELPRTRLEISVLTEPTPLADARELVLGRDGVELVRGAARAVFLPQVAPEHGWDSTRLLEQLALKAGLSKDGWRDARLHVFRAEVFGE